MDAASSPTAKRKRSPDLGPSRTTPVSSPSANSSAQINYLLKSRDEKMKLIEGDVETFSDVLNLIDDYESVLQRQESLAANLGAKLVGPLLVKSFEKIFDNPIKILQAHYAAEGTLVSWIDVIDFARNKPQEFVLSESNAGQRVCQFWTKQCHVQISEDDWRLVISGAPQRMIPTTPIADDEVSELGTLEILEQRLTMLIKKADLVAGRARQLNYHLKGRKSAINARRNASPTDQLPSFTSAPNYSAFQPINTSQQSSSDSQSRSIHQDLLRQFISEDPPRRTSLSWTPRGKTTRTNSDAAPYFSMNPSHSLSVSSAAGESTARRVSHSQGQGDDGTGGPYRPIMTARVEKLSRGDAIWPPCDRCKRLNLVCTKHLTACSGCTKKHARCGWRDMSAEEVDYLGQTPEAVAIGAGGLGGLGGGAVGGGSGGGSIAGGGGTNGRSSGSAEPGPLGEMPRPDEEVVQDKSNGGAVGSTDLGEGRDSGKERKREQQREPRTEVLVVGRGGGQSGRNSARMSISEEHTLSQMAAAAAALHETGRE